METSSHCGGENVRRPGPKKIRMTGLWRLWLAAKTSLSGEQEPPARSPTAGPYCAFFRGASTQSLRMSQMTGDKTSSHEDDSFLKSSDKKRTHVDQQPSFAGSSWKSPLAAERLGSSLAQRGAAAGEDNLACRSKDIVNSEENLELNEEAIQAFMNDPAGFLDEALFQLNLKEEYQQSGPLDDDCFGFDTKRLGDPAGGICPQISENIIKKNDDQYWIQGKQSTWLDQMMTIGEQQKVPSQDPGGFQMLEGSFFDMSSMVHSLGMEFIDDKILMKQRQTTSAKERRQHRIERRREARARLATRYVLLPRQRYQHESRHRHALNRKRGSQGRFHSSSKAAESRAMEKDAIKRERKIRQHLKAERTKAC